MSTAPLRDYQSIAAAVRAAISDDCDRSARMNIVIDAIWEFTKDAGVSWVGFYLADETQPEDRRLILGPRRDRPACSPIGLHGVCGAAYRTGEIQIVHDVADLGENYVACDPRDRSEIVIPLQDSTSAHRWGVLDLDSFNTNAFAQPDADGLLHVLRAAALAH